MKLSFLSCCGALLLACVWGDADGQVIVKYSYRPPETVQRVVVPVNPSEKRVKVLIISGRNSYEHDWTGVNNTLRTLLLLFFPGITLWLLPYIF